MGDAFAEDVDPNGVAAWAAWAASSSAPADGADQWQAWQAAAAEAGYDIGPEAAAAPDEEPEAPPGVSDVEDDADQPPKREPKVYTIVKLGCTLCDDTERSDSCLSIILECPYASTLASQGSSN